MKLKRTVLGPILVALFAFASGGWLLQRGVEAGREPDGRVLLEILDRLSRDYVDEERTDDLYRMAVEGLLRELGDPHTSFMSAEDYARLRVQTTGEYGGLGIQIAERDGWITILAPLPGTPAERAGLLAGDRIIEVEGKSTEGWTDEDAVDVLRGGIGEPVTVNIGRPGVQDPIAFSLVREEIHVNSVRTAYMIEPEIGYARLDLFSETSTDELRAAITDLKEQGMRGMILDLRANPGGLLDQGVSVTDLFVDRGAAIVETRARDPQDNVTFRASRGQEYEGMPIVVLVNEYSASAAEIVAGALQDHDRALVVGAPTFGKGSVQTLFALSGGNFLKMTTGKWYTPSGRSIQKDEPTQEDSVALLGDDPRALDGQPVPDEIVIDTTQLEEFNTDGGRVVYGGGGIVPDLIISNDSLTTTEREFFDAASRAGNKYWDVIFRYAVDYVRATPSLEPGFSITPTMETEIFEMLVADGVEVTWEQLQGARRLVDSQLGSEIAQAKWGQEGRAQRANRDDTVVRTAIELLQQAPNQQSLFSMAETRAQVSR
ncbi:MAG: PDZ domain-containing protein [Gemmatimonas sp.]|nr:PDZ domain-containing protein [Gemmatimonas sp.]